MEYLIDSWSLVVILLAAFVIGWAAETAQTFIPKALALSILAWLQTLPEFAVEAAIAWDQNRDLMIANLTGSLRLLVGLGWPLIFFVHMGFQGVMKGKKIREIVLHESDSQSVLYLFISVLYFVFVLIKGTLTCWDSVWLILIYSAYLITIARQPVEEVEDVDDLPWIGKKIIVLPYSLKVASVTALFVLGGWGLWVSVHPFIDTLQKWSVALGVSTFVFIQWVAPFLSEFPEKVTAFNWARQSGKAQMGVMNMVSSNINQWTMLAAMIPIVFNISLGHFEPVVLDSMHWKEMALTVAQSFLAGILILDLRFSIWDAAVLFILWITQFFVAGLREEVLICYLLWIAWEAIGILRRYAENKKLPRALEVLFLNR